MYMQEILEVGIGLVFMWLIISIAAMQFQEWFATLFKWRAKGLEDALRSMLGGEGEGQALTDLLYSHPLIASLSSSSRRKPSYIPANKFALVLFDLVMTADTEAWPVKKVLADVEALVASITDPEQKKLAAEDFQALLATAKQIAGTSLGEAAIDSLKLQIQAYGDKHPELRPAIEMALPQLDAYYQSVLDEQRKVTSARQDKDLTLRQLRLGLLAMDAAYPNMKKTLDTLFAGLEEYVKEGEQALALGRKNIESWFNDSMDRLSGWYKRRSQLVAFLSGLILALILNVDSINIATKLWREPALRQAVAASADAYAQQQAQLPSEQGGQNPEETIQYLESQLRFLNLPVGWTLTAFDTGGKQCTPIPTSADQIFGFPGKSEQGEPVCKYVSNFPLDWSSGLAKLAGLLITGAATAQGAPFWFEILKKLVNVRSSGPNPAEKEKAAG